ncbi:MAG: HAD-IIB family hydrolase [Pseudomonadota bacterium]
MTKLIIFTDLDGTLLSHNTYDFTPALSMLETLKHKSIPVILASSKTAAEIFEIQKEMKLEAYPAIVENGAGILTPGAQITHYNTEIYDGILRAVMRLPLEFRAHFTGFSQWSVEDISNKTGLTLERAALAKQRQFSEPGLWTGTRQKQVVFEALLKRHGIYARKGGRFLTLTKEDSKADLMKFILSEIEPNTGEAVFSVALGDAPNDIEMIETADIGVIVSNPNNAPLPKLKGEQQGHIFRTTLPGPEGWVQAVEQILRNQDME